jgi:hypothetical protein
LAIVNSAGTPKKCCDSGQAVAVELPDHRFVAIQSLDAADEDDSLVIDLMETNAAFRALVEKSAASPRKPFGVTG